MGISELIFGLESHCTLYIETCYTFRNVNLNAIMNITSFIKERITAADFDRFHELMEITKTRQTHILTDPTRMTTEEIMRLAKVIAVAPYELMQFECGERKITPAESKEISQLREVC